MLMGHVGIYPYQSQLAMWQVVTQSYTKIGVPNISPNESQRLDSGLGFGR